MVHRTISAYLSRPARGAHSHRSWQGFRTQFVEIKRDNPHIVSRTLVALIIWCVVIGLIQSLVQLSPGVTSHQVAIADPSLASATTSPAKTAAPNFVAAVHAQILPGGPSGQLLPPGTMAADRTYANSYAWGQCTWYVAGRRQIPSNWGNAGAWYYHAVSSGWSVGTTPAIAAIAWTPAWTNGAGAFGHVALVEQTSAGGTSVYISEMNYLGIGRKSFRWVSSKQFKYIY